jgi:hypothetical protein
MKTTLLIFALAIFFYSCRKKQTVSKSVHVVIYDHQDGPLHPEIIKILKPIEGDNHIITNTGFLITKSQTINYTPEKGLIEKAREFITKVNSFRQIDKSVSAHLQNIMLSSAQVPDFDSINNIDRILSMLKLEKSMNIKIIATANQEPKSRIVNNHVVHFLNSDSIRGYLKTNVGDTTIVILHGYYFSGSLAVSSKQLEKSETPNTNPPFDAEVYKQSQLKWTSNSPYIDFELFLHNVDNGKEISTVGFKRSGQVYTSTYQNLPAGKYFYRLIAYDRGVGNKVLGKRDYNFYVQSNKINEPTETPSQSKTINVQESNLNSIKTCDCPTKKPILKWVTKNKKEIALTATLESNCYFAVTILEDPTRKIISGGEQKQYLSGERIFTPQEQGTYILNVKLFNGSNYCIKSFDYIFGIQSNQVILAEDCHGFIF